MIKLVAFDWNGTLLADMKALVEGVNEEMKVLNHPPITIGQYRRLQEMPLINFYKGVGVSEVEIKAKAQQISEAFHSYYEPHVAKARTRQGARETIQTLAQKGITNIVLSNHTAEAIYLHLERLNLLPYFETVLANEDIHQAHFTGKEDRLRKYMQNHAINPAEVAVVGDTTEEIRICQNLGTKSIAITGGYNSIQRLKAAKPDVLIHKLRDIIPVLEDL